MKQIRLTQGCVAIVDDNDYDNLAAYKWYAQCIHGVVYAARRTRKAEGGKARLVLMHRQILGAQPGEDVDHRSHKTLDNRRANIRICTRSQNMANLRKTRGTSQYKGVSYYKRDCNWSAQITCDGRKQHLGYFDDECDAALAYNVAALDEWHEFALLNSIPDEGGQT